MKENKKKSRLWLKILCIVLAVVVLIAAALGISVACIWKDEISTIRSFKQLRARNDEHDDGSVYQMNVKGGFYFSEFLQNGGASGDTELINFITEHITRGLVDMSIKETDIGCSSFTAVTPEGDVLFGRNYDMTKTNVCLTVTDPQEEGRHKSFSTVDLSYVGMDVESDVSGLMNKITCLAASYAPLDGINDAGVSCGIYMSYQGGDKTVATNQSDAEKDDITSTTMLRMVLDYADDVEEAVELIQKYNLHDSANTSFHYMVADATGKSAILEWVPAGENCTDALDNDGSARELVVTYNTDENFYGALHKGATFNYQWITNFIIQDGYYESDDDKPGYDRYEYIAGQLQKTGGVVADEQAAMEILQAVGRRTWNGGGGCTVHSVVYNLTKRTIYWVSNENFDDPTAVYRFSLADL